MIKGRFVFLAAVVCGVVLAGRTTVPAAIRTATRFSLFHVPFFDEFTPTEDERWAAMRTVTAVAKNDAKAAGEALAAYSRIEPEDTLGTANTGLRWLCKYVAAAPAQQEEIRRDPYNAAFLQYWSANGAAPLKQYVDNFFRGLPLKMADEQEAHDQATFLDHLMRFNNPRRGDWERSADVLGALGLKEGGTIVDAAAATGCYTLKFSDAVGATGKVYAVETGSRPEEFLKSVLKQSGRRNIEVVKGRADSIAVAGPVDAVFMASRYSEIYTTWTLQDRDALVASIREALKPDGTLAILDHGPAEGQPMPGQQAWVEKGLLVGQLEHYGFSLVREKQLNPQRYLLVFRKSAPAAPGKTPAPSPAALTDGGRQIQVTSRLSLGYILTIQAFEAKGEAIEAGRHLYKALETKDMAEADAALAVYQRLIPVQNYGGEYTALQWFAETLKATDAERQKLIGDRYTGIYYRYFTDNDYAVLKEYLKRRYHLGTVVDINPDDEGERWTFLEDLILFNNPRRESWEKTSTMIEALELKPGQVIADIGSGPGYYSFQFAEKVGPGGRVYAIDINDRHHEYVAEAVKQLGIDNITIVHSRTDDITVTDKVDLAYLCSLYHVIYGINTLEPRDNFIESIKRALKPDGVLVVADNDVVPENVIPYHGPRIVKELIIAQLRNYGFELVATHQFIPQRYVLKFKLAPQAPSRQ